MSKPEACTDAAYFLDEFVIDSRLLYVRGWAKDFDLSVRLDSKELPSITQQATHYDEKIPSSWGFILTAILPSAVVDRSKLEIQLRPGIVVVNPSGRSALTHDLMQNFPPDQPLN